MATELGFGTYATVRADGETAIKSITHKNFESAIREISTTAICDHAGVIKVQKIEYDGCETRIHMRKYSCDLFEFLERTRCVPIRQVYELSRDIISACEHIHSKNIIHGDIKPQNILLDSECRATICDFGIAVMSDEKYHTSRIQTSTYRAPEVDYYRYRVLYSTHIDMWSIGCILYELAAGMPLYRHRDCEDSSIYACEAFGLCGRDRKQRMKLLRALTKSYVLDRICAKLSNNQERYRELFDAGFISLISLCLHPNHNKRIDANSALSIIYRLSSTRTQPRQLSLRADQTSARLCGLPHDITSACKSECLRLAERIYYRYTEKCAVPRDEIKFAAVFIAASIYSGSINVVPIIERHLKRSRLLGTAAAIMVSLNNQIL